MAGAGVIDYYQFGLLSDEDHRRRSAVLVTSYELSSGNQPVRGGLHDPRMGTVSDEWRCDTCRHDKRTLPGCPGHPGHVPLRVPVQDPLGVEETRRWLRVACLSCGALMVSAADYARVPPQRRLVDASSEDTEGRKCPKCKEVHPKIVKDPENHFSYYAEVPAPRGEKGRRPPARAAPGALKGSRKLQPVELKTIFERVSDEACRELGRALEVHPRHMLRLVAQVPGNTTRPAARSFVSSAAASQYHDATNCLQHIVKKNTQLPERLPEEIAENSDLARSIESMQELYYDLLQGSSSTSATQGSGGARGIVSGGKPASSYLKRFPRKPGRIRDNLLGKRVLIISRTTISGNTKLQLDQVGIPQKFAETMQVEETLQEYNREQCLAYVLSPSYPRATRVRDPATGESWAVDSLRADFQFRNGLKIERDLVDGDPVFFNRAPSLERSSIGVMWAVVLRDPRDHTFQMNVASCEWWNADLTVTSRSEQVAAWEGATTPLGTNSVSVAQSEGNPSRTGYNYLVFGVPNGLQRRDN